MDEDANITKLILRVLNKNKKQSEYRKNADYLLSNYVMICNNKKLLRIMNKNQIRVEYIWEMKKSVARDRHINALNDNYPNLANRKFNNIKSRFSFIV